MESPSDKGANGLLSLHLAGTVTRTAVAPLERVKLLIQSQKTGRLSDQPYKGITPLPGLRRTKASVPSGEEARLISSDLSSSWSIYTNLNPLDFVCVYMKKC